MELLCDRNVADKYYPVTQLLTMVANVTFAGETPLNLDSAFLTDEG